MIKNLIRQFAGGAGSTRRGGRRAGGHRRGRSSGGTGAQVGRMVEQFLRRRR